MMGTRPMMNRAPQPEQPPRVRPIEWVILIGSMGFAALTMVWQQYQDLVTATIVLTLLAIVLALIAAIDCINARVLGKLFIALGMLAYFWIEAAGAALQTVPFTVMNKSYRLPVRIWPRPLVSSSLIYLTVFAFMFYVGYSVRPRMRRTLEWCKSWTDRGPVQYKGWIGIFLILAWVPPVLRFGASPGAVWSGLMGGRNISYADWYAAGWFDQASMFALFGVAVVLLNALLEKHAFHPRRIYRLGISCFFLLPFFLGGTRHFLLYALVPPVIAILRKSHFHLTNRQILGGTAVGVLLLIGVQFQSAARDRGWSKVDTSAVATTGMLWQYNQLLYAEYLVPADHDYFMEPTTPYFFIYAIPRKFWPDKPDMQSWLYYDTTIVGRDVAGSVTPSIIGQFYLNWGIFGVAWIGLWMGFLMVLADRAAIGLMVDKQRAFAVVVGMFYAFVISAFRFYAPYYFYFVIFGFMGLLVLARRQRTRDLPRFAMQPGFRPGIVQHPRA